MQVTNANNCRVKNYMLLTIFHADLQQPMVSLPEDDSHAC
jgi:hypothetical protein